VKPNNEPVFFVNLYPEALVSGYSCFMESFTYSSLLPADLDYRACFINRISQEVMGKSVTMAAAAEKIRTWVPYFDALLRNAYELYDTQTPLVGLAKLLVEGAAEDWGMDEQEYAQALKNTQEAVIRLGSLPLDTYA
jgi:hypothetical protein